MGPLMTKLIGIAIIYLAVHEGGHFFFAMALGGEPKFSFDRGLSVEFHVKKLWQFRLICEAGFGMGMICGLVLIVLFGVGDGKVDKAVLLCYWSILALHYWTYPWRAPAGTNDFNGMCAHNEQK